MNIEELLRQTRQIWHKLTLIMKTGGFFENMMKGGPELDRVKKYLRIIEGTEMDLRLMKLPAINEPNPWPMPIFPGIRNTPYPDPAEFDWVPTLEAAYEDLREEGLRIHDMFHDTPYGNAMQGASGRKWKHGSLIYFGTRCPENQYPPGMCPTVAQDLVASIPQFSGYDGMPFADAYYSSVDPGLHLPAHTSADNLRVRAHVSLKIPEGNLGIRVGGETRRWEEGKVLLLDDSFIHEAWNKSSERRLVLLLDFWNPDLTEVEIRVLKAMMSKAEIRVEAAKNRNMSAKDIREIYHPHFIEQDKINPLIREYWPRQPVSV